MTQASKIQDSIAECIELAHVSHVASIGNSGFKFSTICEQSDKQSFCSGYLFKAQLLLLQVMEQEIVIKPGDNDIVRLSILPLKPGLLRVTGLEWVLNGQAQGRRLFAAKAPQHRRTGSR